METTLQQRLDFYNHALKLLENNHWTPFLCVIAQRFLNIHGIAFNKEDLKEMYPEVCSYANKNTGSVMWKIAGVETNHSIRVEALKMAIQDVNTKINGDK